MRITHPSSRARQHGATLIEVLVSFLIISFGLLALLALQNNAIQYNKTTEYRSIATMLATDLAERMRSNRAEAIAGGYNIVGTNTAPTTMPTRTACSGQQSGCTAATLAAQDVSEWRRLAFMSLPGGRAHVQVVSDGGKGVDVTANIWVAWDDPGGSNEVAGDTGETIKECAAALIPATGTTPSGGTQPSPPRCAFFNIGL